MAAVEVEPPVQLKLLILCTTMSSFSEDGFSTMSLPFNTVNDIALADYIGVTAVKHATYVPHTAGRYQMKRFRKAQCPIVERADQLSYDARTQQREKIDGLVLEKNATRIGSAGVVRRQAVDISPIRRVNQAIYLLTTGARESAFRNIKTIAECLADELINAAKGSSNSYAIKKRMKLKELPRPTVDFGTMSRLHYFCCSFCLILNYV
ncbi:40S ribosomal protein S5-2 [Bienertia sinuspersici]